MKIIIIMLSLMCPTLGQAFSCFEAQKIHKKFINFDEKRIALTREYQLTHYGIDSNSIEIEPRMIVLHWTSIPSLAVSFNVFNQQILPANRRDKLSGDLNVSAHFLVDRDGRIYQLMPLTWMARHVIGLNHYALGIENVGGGEGVDNLTSEQTKANAFLVCYLKEKFPQINHVIGHNDYMKYKKTALWLEKDANYITEKEDPGPVFLRKVKKLVKASRS